MADLTGQTLLGKYRIVGQLGQGGMGKVWRGMHVRTGRRVAIKVLDERFLSNSGIVQRFGREARAASAIQHPGIVEVLDLDQTDAGVPFLVMELLEGETLAKLIERQGRLSQDQTISIMSQLLEALDAAHAHGVVHRDLKPDNVVLLPRGNAPVTKILDFGISQKDDERIANLTLAGSVLGTPHYMAPEQAMGEDDIDGRADIYAAGVVMYECVVGEVPYDAPNYNRLIQVILHEQPVPPTERGAKIDPGVEEVILRAIDKDRATRPQTAGAMAEMLQAVTSDTTMPFDRETLGFVRQDSEQNSGQEAGRTNDGGPSRGALASTMAQDGDHGEHGGNEHQRPGPSSVEVDLPELELDPPPGKPPVAGPVTAPSTGAPSVEPAGGPSAQDDPDPLSFESRLGAGSAGEGSLELDEEALARPSRPPRSRGSLPPRDGGSPASPPSSPGRVSSPPDRVPSYGRISAAPPSAPSPDPWHARVPSSAWTLLGGVLVVLALILGLRTLVRPGAPPQVEEVAPVTVEADEEDTAAPALRNVRIEVDGLPPGARIELDGLPAGRPPLRVRQGSTHTLEISAPGYESRILRFTADGDQRLDGALRPESGDGRRGASR